MIDQQLTNNNTNNLSDATVVQLAPISIPNQFTAADPTDVLAQHGVTRGLDELDPYLRIPDPDSPVVTHSDARLPLNADLTSPATIVNATTIHNLPSTDRNNYCRWTILWAMIMWSLTTLPIWLAFAAPCNVTFYVILGLMSFSDFILFGAVVFTAFYLIRVRWFEKSEKVMNHVRKLDIEGRRRDTVIRASARNLHQFVEQQAHEAVIKQQRRMTRASMHLEDEEVIERRQSMAVAATDAKLYHIAMICMYKEPVEVLERTLTSLAQQTLRHRMIVAVGCESATPNQDQLRERLIAGFGNTFYRLVFTCHPRGIPGEVAGKCSNVNWIIRSVTRQIFSGHLALPPEDLHIDNFTVTNGDADTAFSPLYFYALDQAVTKMRSEKDPNVAKTIWQAGLFYNWEWSSSYFFTRITGLFRTTFLIGAQLAYSINCMSIFSFTLELSIRGGFSHPQYFMEDVAYLINCSIGIQDKIQIRPLPIPVISGPTSGVDLRTEFREWFVQAKRWGIGTADTFHYFVTKFAHLPWQVRIGWTVAFIGYYGCILTTCALLSIMSAPFPYICPNLIGFDGWMAKDILLVFGLIPYIAFFFIFILDAVWCRYILQIREDISPIRNLIHFLLSGVTLTMYAVVQLYAYTYIVYMGRACCDHGRSASDKSQLSTTKQRVEPAAATRTEQHQLDHVKNGIQMTHEEDTSNQRIINGSNQHILRQTIDSDAMDAVL